MQTDSSNREDLNDSLAGNPARSLVQRAVSGLLVSAQLLLACLLIFLQPSPRQQVLPLVLHLSGIAIGLWAVVTMGRRNLNVSPAVRDGANLVERGPYRLVRHPMYTGLLLFTASYMSADRSAWSLAMWFGLLFVLVVKSRYEESLLAGRFPSYADYRKRTWRFIPYLF